jgi:Tfp pilus assembly protein PilN
MIGTSKADWPKTPSGAIDWERVFEDPEAGLIALVRRTRSAAALRECMIAIVSRLYVRKDDPLEIERFVNQLRTMLPDRMSPTRLARTTDAMVDMLRQIKSDRILKVLEYEAAKAEATANAFADIAGSTAPGKERRSKSNPVELTELARGAVARHIKRIVHVAAGLAVVAAVAGTMIATYIENAPQREAKRNATLLLEQAQAASRGEAVTTHVFGGRLYVDRSGARAVVTIEGLTADQCANAGWMLAKKGGITVDDRTPTNLSLNTFTALCASNPGNPIVKWSPRTDE